MTTVSTKQSKWKDSHDDLSRVLIASLMKKFGSRKPDVARELGITTAALRWNIRRLNLTPAEINKYAIGAGLLSKAPQTTNQKPAADKVA